MGLFYREIQSLKRELTWTLIKEYVIFLFLIQLSNV